MENSSGGFKRLNSASDGHASMPKGMQGIEQRQQNLRKELDNEVEAEGFNAVRDTNAVMDEEEQETLYHTYQPKKLSNCSAPKHPDPAVETRTLAQTDPPDVWYNHRLADACQKGTLSSLQIETVVYANQRWSQRFEDGHQTRAGFFLGDGAGLGKGRQISALLYEHFRGHGKRAVWLSVSPDLKLDAMRDVQDLALPEHLPLHPENGSLPNIGENLNKKLGDGVLFMTYATMIMSRRKLDPNVPPEELAIPGSRIKQLVDWLSVDQEPLIVLDECHKAKNAMSDDATKQSKTARVVIGLQRLLPSAKVLYCSATGVSAVQNLAYMERLGNFGFENNKELIDSLRKAGLGAMEAFSMGLRATGAYVARTLSYEGAEFQVREVSMTSVHKVMYDRAAEFWQLLTSIGSVMTNAGLGKSSSTGALQRQMWSSHQRFFRQLLLSIKVPAIVRDAIEAVYERGQAVVIGLQSTGEANVTQAISEGEHDDDDSFASAPRQMLTNFIKNHIPDSAEPQTKTCAGLTENQARRLYYQVKLVVDQWRQVQPASFVAQHEQGKQQNAEIDDNSIEVEIAAEKSFEEAEKDKLERAKKAGNFIDLSDPTTDQIEQHIDERFEKNTAKANELAEKRRQKEVELAERERREMSTLRQQYDQNHNANEQHGGHNKMEEAQRGQEQDYHNENDAQVGREEFEDKGQQETDNHVVVLDHHDEDHDRGADTCATAKVGKKSYQSGPRGFLVSRKIQSKAHGKGKIKKLDNSTLKYLCIFDTGEAKWMEHDFVTELLVPLRSPGTPCMICKVNGEDCMLCDVCDGPWHFECLGEKAPPQNALEWKCPKCSKDDSPKQSNASNGSTSNMNVGEANTAKANGKQSANGEFENNVADNVSFIDDEEEAEGDSINIEDNGDYTNAEEDQEDEEDEYEEDDDDRYIEVLKTHSATAQRGSKRATTSASEKKPPPKKQKRDERDVQEIEDDYVTARPSPGDRWLHNMKALLLEGAKALELPPNPLDHAIDMLGGEKMVAEMTGRDVHFIRQSDGTVSLVQRRPEVPRNCVNITERDDFMSGRKQISIISEAASTGISLHADKRFPNQRRRSHLVAELPWSADKAIQQCGRSHRSYQRSAPSYKIMVTGVGGERRFASAAAARLQSLGAILSGDRHAAGVGNQLKSFDVDTKYGSKAVSQMFTTLAEPSKRPPQDVHFPPVDEHLPQSNRRSFYQWAADQLSAVELAAKQPSGRAIVKPTQKNQTVPRFLNRLLGLPVNDQSILFDFFQQILEGAVMEAKTKGQYDSGIVTLRESNITLEEKETIHTDKDTGAQTHLFTLKVDRGLTFDEALKALHSCIDAGQADQNTGFWQFRESSHAQIGVPRAVLVTPIVGSSRRRQQYRIRRPNNARIPFQYNVEDLKNNYTFVPERRYDKLRKHWELLHTHYERGCAHGLRCSRRNQGFDCNVGCRITFEFVLSGAILPVYKVVHDVLNKQQYETTVEADGDMKMHKQPLSVVSTCTTDEEERKIVGIYIPHHSTAQHLREALEGCA